MNKEEKRAYDKKYRELNIDKIKERNKKYRELNKDKILKKDEIYRQSLNKDEVKEYNINYRMVNLEKIKTKEKIYREKNREKIKQWRKENIEYFRRYDKSEKRKEYLLRTNEKRKKYKKEYREKNKEQIQKREKEWKKNNPDKVAASNAKRKAIKKNAILPDTDFKQIEWLYIHARKMTEKFGVIYHVDHVIPLSKGGPHHQDNMVIMRADYNLKKNDRIIPELIKLFSKFEYINETAIRKN